MDSSIHVLPSIKVLSPEAITQIHTSSLKILYEIGIRVDSAKAIKVFKSAPGVKFLDEQRLVIHPETADWQFNNPLRPLIFTTD
jgi:trimethylamine:corrinoid methyltransferase-like protein